LGVKNGKGFENQVLVLKTVIFIDFPVSNVARIFYFTNPGAEFPNPGVNLGNEREDSILAQLL
jgi:hypothetical protein